jgi:type VI secretion system protein ImpD
MKESIISLIQALVAKTDYLLSCQVNTILHHPRFQQLEASWRGLYYLVNQVAETGSKKVKVRILNVTWLELGRDLTRAVEFDQSQLFLKIYNEEFGHPGGEPFGLLIGDYSLTHRAKKGQAVNDITLLQNIAKIAAAAFAPFVAAADASLLGLDDFASLERPLDLERTFQQAEYHQWKALCEDEDARFVGLTLPETLMRLPYNGNTTLTHPFCFTEESKELNHFLWGSPAYCFAAAAIAAFAHSGWFFDMRGWLLTNSNQPQVCATERQQKILSDLGFITFSACKHTPYYTFHTCPSLQKPKKYYTDAGRQNAKISTVLHYILCISRFAHYIKVIARDKVGTFSTAQDCENYLQQWVHGYTAATTDMDMTLKAKYPLREAKVQVQERIGSAGNYLITIHLRPHYQFEQVESYLKLTTELIRAV